jgi:hypothetical protein
VGSVGPGWWIVYGDRSIVAGSGAADAFAVRPDDVQAIISPCPEHGWETWRRWNTDYYVYMPERDAWRGCDLFGLWDYLRQPGPRKVLFGRTQFNDEYNALMKWLDHHPDLPAKSGYRPGER